MGLRYALATGALAVTLAALCSAQERFETGWLKGFTKSSTEHVIVVGDEPFTVRAVRGVVLDATGAEREGVVVEIRDQTGQIRGTNTNGQGRFNLHGVPEGRYRFKVTLNGFQSVVGDVAVTKKANKADQIKIVLNFGN